MYNYLVKNIIYKWRKILFIYLLFIKIIRYNYISKWKEININFVKNIFNNYKNKNIANQSNFVW